MTQLPLDAYYDLTEIDTVAIAPDGDRVAFTTTEYAPDEDEPVESLFVVPTDGSRAPHRLTRRSDASAPQWSPDGDRLAFLASRETDNERRVGLDDHAAESQADADADEEPEAQVWQFDLAVGGDATQLTDFEDGVREFDWAPDSERLVVSARDPTDAEDGYLEQRRQNGPIETERMQHKADGVGFTDSVTTYLFVVDPETGAEDSETATRLDDAFGAGPSAELTGIEPAWGTKGRIAFVSGHSAANPDDTFATDVFTINPDGTDLEQVTAGERSCQTPTWSPDGDRLAFGAGDPENWSIPTQAYVYDGETYESVTGDLDRTIARGATLHWADEETFYTRIADEARTRLVRCHADGDVERVFEAQGHDRALDGFDLEPTADNAALVFSHPNDGQNVFSVDTADLDSGPEHATEERPTAADLAGPASLTQLSAVNEELRADHELPEVTRVSYESGVPDEDTPVDQESHGGWDLDGVVYYPPDFDPEDPEPRPLVCAIHGGPISYDEPVFSFNHAALTSRGYIVFRPNYRGGSSYGRKFSEALRGRWGSVEVDDIAAGVRELVDRRWADEDRVFGYGFSYGGIAQGFLVTQYPDLFTAAAPEHGIYDLRSAFGTDDTHNWLENEYGQPWDEPEAYDASSAITDAGNIEIPLLVTAGGEDWRCPPSQSEQLYLAAKKNGVDARLVVYPDEHHNIGDPDRAIHRLEEVTAWYRRHDPAVEDAQATDPHDRNVSEGDTPTETHEPVAARD